MIVDYSDSDSANSDGEGIDGTSEPKASNALDALKAKSTNILNRLPPPQNAAKRAAVKRKIVINKLDILDNKDDEVFDAAPSIAPTTSGLADIKSGSTNNILTHLPAPKNPIKRVPKKTPIAAPTAKAEEAATSSEDDDDGLIDNAYTITPIESFDDNEDAYSAAPLIEQQPETSVPAKKTKTIGDEQAQRLIYKAELEPWGASDNMAREAVMNIRDFNVDRELGPDVNETLLRNLNNRAMASISLGPLPEAAKKAPKDKLAKQKHQITHLAHLAVAREEHLQEQWAEGRHKKRETARKYGFS